MKKDIKAFVYCILFISVFTGCNRKKQALPYSYHPSGYYYQLLSFETDSVVHHSNTVLWIAASFRTQSDSVFWDSYNNLNDHFYLEKDSLIKDNFLKQHMSASAVCDSVCLLIKPGDFFRQQFKTQSIPFFSKKDSVVKVNFKIKQVLSRQAFIKVKQNLLEKEEAQIKKYFGTKAEMEAAEDPLGFYWVDRSETAQGKELLRPGDLVALTYKGEYLTGRFLEKSPEKFELAVGTPDQLLKGLNYVISRLKLGENAKIILPSRLAFGENGSSNGMVPPFTPLVYEIKILEHKKNSDPAD